MVTLLAPTRTGSSSAINWTASSQDYNFWLYRDDGTGICGQLEAGSEILVGDAVRLQVNRSDDDLLDPHVRWIAIKSIGSDGAADLYRSGDGYVFRAPGTYEVSAKI
jgi:hypothetical protein